MEQAGALLALGLLAGLMIGCVGIGGVILVPVMTFAAGIPTGSAVAAAMMGYILTGVFGSAVFLRHGTVDGRAAGALCLGAGPGALAGAVAAQTVDGRVTQGLIAVLAIVSGLHNLRAPRRERLGEADQDTPRAGQGSRVALGGLALVAIGAIVGLFSAMTGTGGPVILVPLLLALGIPVLTAVGLSQTIQVPIALLATLGSLALGALDLGLGTLLSVGLAIGSVVGAALAHRLNRDALRRIAAIILLATGAFIVGQALLHLRG